MALGSRKILLKIASAREKAYGADGFRRLDDRLVLMVSEVLRPPTPGAFRLWIIRSRFLHHAAPNCPRQLLTTL
jgi:hypothetical protein